MSPPAFGSRSKGEAPVAVLKEWALARPFIQILRDHLPQLPADSTTPAPGLYIDAQSAMWSAGKGEVRLSLARLHAVLPGGDRVRLAQLHVTSRQATDGTEDRRVRYYLHDLHGPAIEEMWSEFEWWVSLLERYYSLGGVPVDLGPGVEA